MATDMQPLFSGFPNQGTHSVLDARDRQATVQNQGASRDFDSLLERTGARQATMKQEPASARTGSKPASQTRASHHSLVESHNHVADRSTAHARQERTVGQNDKAQAKTKQTSDEESGSKSVEESNDNSDDQSRLPQEMILAAMIAPAPAMGLPKVQEIVVSDSDASTSPEAAGKVLAATASDVKNTSAAQATSTLSSVQGSVVTASADAAERSPEVKKAIEKGQAGEGTLDVSELPRMDDQGVALESIADRSDVAVKGGNIESDKIGTAVAAITTSKAEAGASKQAAGDQVDRPAFLDAGLQDTSLSVGQEAASAEKYLEKESQQFSDSSAGADQSVPNQATTNETANRPLFLDRMSGLNQPALASNDSSSGRSETGQTTTVLRPSESERMNELRGASPVSQSVMLDLDPLDMGPLRVRVMMSDQTVHAHIRTEHGELGQGLLQQGQSLESSLRTTGLEMGMLRVTVDQQQGRSDNAWMFQQQQQGRPASSAGPHSARGEEERSARGEQGYYTSEHVSIFA